MSEGQAILLTKPWVLQDLERTFHQAFNPKSLDIGRKANGLKAYHEFDAVSEDGRIIAIVDNHTWLRKNGRPCNDRIAKLYQAILFLSMAWAERKLLVLTDHDTYLGFGQESDGKLPKGVELYHAALANPKSGCN